MSDISTNLQSMQVEHVTMRSSKGFAEVRADLERSVPKLDESIVHFLITGDWEHLKVKLEEGPELAIFEWRDRGGLLQVAGLTRKAVQYEIGNPLTASKMTRHKLAAGLYAPLRVLLYADESGGSVFEYDRPSTLFGQFGDPEVTVVARELDAALERALLGAMK